MTTTVVRPAFATPVALCMLVAVGGLAAASFRAVVDARRAATRSLSHERAASVADVGLEVILRSWNVPRWDSLPVGGTDSGVPLAGDHTGADARVFVTRVTQQVFWLASLGRAAPGTSVEAARGQNLLLEVLRPNFPTRAALTSRGAVLVGGNVAILGGDTPPPGWTDCPPTDTGSAPAVLVPGGVPARRDDGGPIPGTHVDPAAAELASYETLGRVLAARLATRADLAVAAGAILSPAPDTRTDCRPAGGADAQRSWGEPLRSGQSEACERLYPVIHAAGDLAVTGGRGQGVLLVNGRLRIDGPFLFHGVILASGGIEASGDAVRVYGAVLSAAPTGVVWRGAGEIRRSTCALGRVAEAAARPYVVPRRGWTELF